MAPALALEGRRILIVEDEYLVADVLRDILEEAGAAVLGPIGSSEEALAFIIDQSTAFDGVVLDLNLHGIRAYAIADALLGRKIVFVFVTGYGADAVDVNYRGHPPLRKTNRCG